METALVTKADVMSSIWGHVKSRKTLAGGATTRADLLFSPKSPVSTCAFVQQLHHLRVFSVKGEHLHISLTLRKVNMLVFLLRIKIITSIRLYPSISIRYRIV